MTGHRILVTGVSRGLGLTIARTLLEAGATVLGVSRSNSDEYRKLQAEHSERARFTSFDLSRSTDIREELFENHLPLEFPLHGFVNNAAVAYDDLVSNLDEVRLRAMFDVNVFSPMLLTKHVIRNMLFHRIPGVIVHISSVCVHTGYKGLAMYGASKGALEAFSKNTAREWGERGIRSNCVVAGFMETEMSSKLTSKQRQRVESRTALKKTTEVKSVSAMVTYLLGDGSSSVTGQNLFVDSGTL